MKPDRARELYSDFAEGTLSPALRLAMEQHFASDADAQADYREFARVYELLEMTEAEEVEAPPGFRAAILEKVNAEQARRESAPAHRAALTLGGLFRGPQRRATGGLIAALAVCAVAGVIVAPRLVQGPNIGGFGPPLPPAIPTTLTGVNTAQDASGSHYNFQLHLPESVPSATVSAYVLSSNGQITDPTQLAQATNALNPPLTLDNHEQVTIPVTMPDPAKQGSTIAMLVQWTPTGSQTTGAQVIYVPTNSGAPGAPVSATTDYFDALQAIAAQDDVTVIADATNEPTQSVAAPSGASPAQAQADLAKLASEVGATVKTLSPNVYQVALNANSPQG